VKIGIYDPYLDDLGGGERYMMTLAQCLSKNNEVFVYWDNQNDLKNLEERFQLDLSKIKLLPNIFSNKISFINRFFQSRRMDAIVLISDGSIPFLLSKKLFLHIQQPFNFRKLSFKDTVKLSRVNKIFCNSNFTKQYVDRIYGYNKTIVIFPPVTVFGKSGKKENMILHVGRFRTANVKTEDYKKQHFMIKVFKDLINEGLKGWEFVIGTSLPDVNDSKFLEMKKSVEGYPIRFLINFDNERLWREGSKAKIYWHASGYGEDLEKNPNLAEHFGISTVEAMGIGAVPVVINAGGQKEIVIEGENGFVWNTEKEFKEKTLKLIQNPSILVSLSKNAIQVAEKFDQNNFCRQIENLIRK
jgi:glycosyltransferase involved in cell wall biosynthesis